MTIGDRLRRYRKEKQLTLEGFAKITNVGVSSISAIENNKTNPSIGTIQKIIKNTDMSSAWLIEGASEETYGGIENTVKVEMLTDVGLGNPYESENLKPLGAIFLSKDLVFSGGKTITKAVRCVGDSMHPTIRDGGIVGVDFEDKTPAENQMFLFRFPYLGLTIKRLQFGKGSFLAVADNKEIGDQHLSRKEVEEGVILGRVKWIHNKV